MIVQLLLSYNIIMNEKTLYQHLRMCFWLLFSNQFMAVYNYNPVEHSPNHYPTYEVAFNEGDIVTVFGSIRSDGFYQGKVSCVSCILIKLVPC